MLEIHTPKSWHSIFSFPGMVIDDEGFIYNGDDYRKLIRNPVGKIDYSSGFIFGSDYFASFRSPIGKIKQDGNVTMVFGEDYHTLSPTPIFYIKGDEIYSYEEYHKLFSTPSYHIKSDSTRSNSGTNSARSNPTNIPDDLPQAGPGLFDAIGKIVKPILIVLILIILSVGSFNNFMRDSVYSPFLVTSLAIALVCDFLFCKKSTIIDNIVYVEFASVFVCWVCIVATDFSSSEGLELFGTIFLTPFLIALMMAVPSIITGTIAYYIKKLIKK